MQGLYYERRLIAGVGRTSFARAGFVHLEVTTAEAEVVLCIQYIADFRYLIAGYHMLFSVVDCASTAA